MLLLAKHELAVYLVPEEALVSQSACGFVAEK